MTYAIIEDEAYALRTLNKMIGHLRPDYLLAFTASSVRDAVSRLSVSPLPDVVFMDIELDDGNSFDIFSKVNIKVPVIFTTAYDNYAIRAFEVNSVDYLLKPISEEKLQRALAKLESTRHDVDYKKIAEAMLERNSRKRILVSKGDSYSYVSIEEVAFFMSEDKYVFAYMKDGKRHITDLQSLNDIMDELDPTVFFQLSRSIVAGISSINDVRKFFNRRLNVVLRAGNVKQEVIVSSARKNDFLSWLGDKKL